MNKSQTTNQEKLDLSPYYIKGIPILGFMAMLITFSMALTAIYEYCF